VHAVHIVSFLDEAAHHPGGAVFALRTELNLTTQAWYGCETSKGIVVSNRCLAKDRTSVLTHGSTQRQANFLPKETSLLESKKRLTLPPDPSNTRIQGAYADIWQQSAQSWSPVRHPGRSHSSFEFRAPSSLAPHAEPSQTWQQRVMTAKHQRQASLLCSLLLSLVTSILGSICTLPFFRGSVLMYRRNDKACVCQKDKADTVPPALQGTDCHFVAFTTNFWSLII